MRSEYLVDLADCREYRQTLEARPPAIVHGAALLLVALLASAVAWAGLTQANLVVRASGRVRPIDVPTQVFASLGTTLDGRVAEVRFREGQHVRAGDVLVQLDTGRLDNDLAKTRRTIATAEEELARLDRLAALLEEQFAVGKSKASAELTQAVAEVERAHQRRASEIRRAEVELATATDQESRIKRLVPTRAATETQLIEATAKVQDAEQKLRLASVSVDEGKLAVLRQALDLVERDFAVRAAELETRRVAKRGEIDAAGKELANLVREHDLATLRAPCDGVVTRGVIKVGDILESGKPVLEIARQQGFRFEVAVASEDVGLLREGMPARIKFDAYDYQKYGTLGGLVAFISPDSHLPDEKSTSKGAMYLVRLDVAGDRVERGDLVGLVKLGMTGRAEIVTAGESLLGILLRRIRSSISLG